MIWETEKKPSSSEYWFSSRNWQSLLKYWDLFIYVVAHLSSECLPRVMAWHQTAVTETTFQELNLCRHLGDATDLPLWIRVVELNMCWGTATCPQCLQLCYFDVLAFMISCSFTLHSPSLLIQLSRTCRFLCC